MMTPLSRSLITLILCLILRVGRGEEEGYNDDDQYNQQQQGDNGGNMDNYGYGDDYIKYWTDYAILPKRCIV